MFLYNVYVHAACHITLSLVPARLAYLNVPHVYVKLSTKLIAFWCCHPRVYSILHFFTSFQDPFINLLSGYLSSKQKVCKLSSTTRSCLVCMSYNPQQKSSAPSQKLVASTIAEDSRSQGAKPTETEEESPLKEQLNIAWKRIADLETRVHDLTLQSTMVS